jgi:hypothetical protein
MTKPEQIAFEQFVYYIKTHYRPIDTSTICAEFDEEFNALVYRVNPKCHALYELSPFEGVFL